MIFRLPDSFRSSVVAGCYRISKRSHRSLNNNNGTFVFRDPASIYQMLSGHPHLNLSADLGLPSYLPSHCNGGFVEATLQIIGVMTTFTRVIVLAQFLSN